MHLPPNKAGGNTQTAKYMDLSLVGNSYETRKTVGLAMVSMKAYLKAHKPNTVETILKLKLFTLEFTALMEYTITECTEYFKSYCKLKTKLSCVSRLINREIQILNFI